jgi:hypothetical protein
MCQKWARQQYESVYGDIFHADNPLTAHLAALEWCKTRYCHAGGNWGQIGDLLYWTGTPSQPEGHVVIRIKGNRIAENSVVHFLWDGDGRGTRLIKNLPRKPDVIVRLPKVAKSKTPPK